MRGRGGGGGTAADVTAPAIGPGQAQLPNGFTFAGGGVTLAADVTDNVGLAEVTALVHPPSGPDVTLAMNSAGGNTYTVDYTAPANLRADGAAELYSITVRASDTSGNTATSPAFTFEVPAASPPPVLPEAR